MPVMRYTEVALVVQHSIKDLHMSVLLIYISGVVFFFIYFFYQERNNMSRLTLNLFLNT